jgi:sigma-54-interacting transcriptional regulator
LDRGAKEGIAMFTHPSAVRSLPASRRDSYPTALPEPERIALEQRRPNVLVLGSHSYIVNTLCALRAYFHRLECSWDRIPALDRAMAATVVVQEIAALPADALDALARLIDQTEPRIQVVATSSTSVYERVQRGEFPEDLYYRLNVITLKEDHERSVAT